VAEFAEALTIIPKVLATNAAKDANELVSKLRVLHSKSQTQPTDEKGYKYSGLDLMKGEVRHNLRHGVIEPTVSKVKCIKYSYILNIDLPLKLLLPF
jgi:T-complex protein 1 subunit alpha